MNITYLIGNGFDINLGLDTRYIDFYKYYTFRENPSDSDAIREFKREITQFIKTDANKEDENSIDWRDLEVALGKWTTRLKETEVNDLVFSLIDGLKGHLTNEYKYLDPKVFEEGELIKYLLDPISKNFSRERAREILSFWRSSSTPDNINIISFNYTESFERLSGFEKGPINYGVNIAGHPSLLIAVHHIHQTLKEDDILVGLNDVSQIENKDFHNNRHICNILVKPNANAMLGTGVDRDCEEIIGATDLFIVFGTSAGITDRKWWSVVCNRIKDSKARLLYFVHAEKHPHLGLLYDTMSEDAIRGLVDSAGLKEESVFSKVYSRSYVCFTSGLFKLEPSYSFIPTIKMYRVANSDVTISVRSRGTKYLTLLVNAPNEETGILAERLWIKDFFPDYHNAMQSISYYLVQDVELPYDKITITSETSNKDLFFEIASFYGKSNLKLIDLPSEEQRSSALVDMMRKMYGG